MKEGQLRSLKSNVYWADDELKALSNKTIDEMSNDELKFILKQLDRRFIQLWDKVVFERVNDVTNYEKIKERNDDYNFKK
jgi:hypothetical protein